MAKVYKHDKTDMVKSDWFTIWSSEENGYTTKLSFCSSMPELNYKPGFIVSVYDRLMMKLVKMTIMEEDDFLSKPQINLLGK